jgi:hypothetical protein
LKPRQTHPPAWPKPSPARVRDVTKLRAEVQIVAPGSLPNDGKVISDQRSLA